MRSFYSFYADAAKIALQSIFAHKLRTFLTLIGIIIGVASVVVVGASISGLNSYVVTQISKVLGVNHFMIARMASVGSRTEEEWEAMNKRNKRLEWDDYEWLKEQCRSCKEVGAQLETRIDLKHEGHELFGTEVAGVTANMGEIEDKTVVEGRFLVTHEVDNSSYVCVIGWELREKFYDGVDPIGKYLKIQGVPLRIVGVEEKRGSMFGQTLDNHAYIPVTTFGKMFGRRQSLQLHGKAENREQFLATIEQARIAMRNRHRLKGDEEDDFGMVNVEQVNNQVDQLTGAIAGVVVPITFISLLVGGIVVMNMMLFSVTERTFEIGLRKAVGAKSKHILMQFLIESSLLSAFGGLLGLLLAAGIASLINVTTPVPMTITLPYIVLSLGVSGGIGMLFGIYPAIKASRMDPILALTKA
ncbi:MAG TPA: ABC transporter permease [Blastocatellia bacterium]|nr:ABC transporter permease [Blastocatellia bacterium]